MAKGTRSKTTNIFVWILMGLLIIGLTGFGINSVGSSRNQTVGSVGDEEITANSYALALNNELASLSQRFGQNITLDQAIAFGVDRQVLAQLINTAALDGEASKRKFSVGDTRVKNNLLSTQAFRGPDGAFDQATYEFALSQAGLNPSEYDEIIRSQDSRAILQLAIGAGILPSTTYADTLITYLGEGRDFRWTLMTVDAKAEAAIPVPTSDKLQTYYTDNADAFTLPQTRKITYISLTPEMLLDSITPDETVLQEAYDAQEDLYNVAERRILDRLVFETTEAAQAAMLKIIEGTASFEDLVKEQGLELVDVNLGATIQDDLDLEAYDKVFATTEPGLVGPVESALGPALFRVNAILEGQTTTFEEARADLATVIVADMARNQIANGIADIEDLLAGGATLEELAEETDVTLATIDFTAGSDAGIAAYEAFRIEAAASAEGEFPEVRDLSDGGIFALRLDSIIEPTLQPLEVVRDAAIAGWRAKTAQANLLKKAAYQQLLLKSGGKYELLELPVQDETNIRRDAFVDLAPANMVAEVFAANIGDVLLVEGGNSIAIVRVMAAVKFDDSLPESIAVASEVQTQFSQQLGRDIFEAYASALKADAGISLNQPVINGVHLSFSQGGFNPAAMPGAAHNDGDAH